MDTSEDDESSLQYNSQSLRKRPIEIPKRGRKKANNQKNGMKMNSNQGNSFNFIYKSVLARAEPLNSIDNLSISESSLDSGSDNEEKNWNQLNHTEQN